MNFIDLSNINTGIVSDGYHTFNELYDHRNLLFINLMIAYPGLSWASKKHFDGSSYEGWFIAGIDLPEGQITYHIPDGYWEAVENSKVEILDKGRWDGHSSNDVILRMRKRLGVV